MNIILLMLPVLLLMLDLTQIVSTVRTLRAGIFDLVKFPVSKIILHYSFLSKYYTSCMNIWETYWSSLNIDFMHEHRMMFAMDRDTETGHAIQGKSMLPFIFVNVGRNIDFRYMRLTYQIYILFIFQQRMHWKG